MNPLFAAALDLEEFCRSRAWRFCFIGGLVVHRWGEPRLTLDVDCTVMTELGAERPIIDALIGAYAARIPEPASFALANRVLLLRGSGGVPLDIALGGMPFEQRCIDRATPFAIGNGQSLVTASAEDLIVLKAFAGRDRDWIDIESVIHRQGEALDTALIWQELEPLLELKEDVDAASRLRRLLRK